MRLINLSVYLRYLFLSLFIIHSAETECQKGSRVIDYNTRIKVSNGSLEETRYYLIEVGGKESTWISDIRIPFKKSNKIDIIEASVLNSSGVKIKDLKKKDIVTRSYISSGVFFEDNLVNEFTLRGDEYPYRIRYSYRIVYNTFFNITNWVPILYPDIFTEKASLILEVPKDFKIKVKASGEFIHKTDTTDDWITLSWEIKDLAPFRSEILMSPVEENVPRVSIVPETFYYGTPGSLQSWKSFGEWITGLNKGLTELPLSEQNKIDSLVSGLKDKKEIIRKLYHYMQDHTRYINVSISIGGLKPYPASYVCTNKYGDCKALTIYMKALLEHAGINAYYTLVKAGGNPELIDPEFISQQFNHVILCIPLEKDTIWLENTASYLPYNYLGGFTQNRYALLVNGENSMLVRTPPFKAEEILGTTNFFITLNSEGSGQAIIQKTLRGNEFDEYIHARYEMTEPEQKKMIENEIIPDKSQLITWKILHDDKDIPYLKMDLVVSISDQFRKIGNSFILNTFPLKINNLENPEERKYPVRIFSPIYHKDSIVYELPFYFNFKAILPKDVNVESKYGYYTASYFVNGRKFGLIRKYQIYSNEYTLQEYPEFYNFIVAIRKSQRESIIIINKL